MDIHTGYDEHERIRCDSCRLTLVSTSECGEVPSSGMMAVYYGSPTGTAHCSTQLQPEKADSEIAKKKFEYKKEIARNQAPQ